MRDFLWHMSSDSLQLSRARWSREVQRDDISSQYSRVYDSGRRHSPCDREEIIDLGRRCDFPGRISSEQQTRSSRQTLDGESRAEHQQSKRFTALAVFSSLKLIFANITHELFFPNFNLCFIMMVVEVAILYFVWAAAAFEQHAHGLRPSPWWLGYAGQMGAAASLGRKGAIEEPKDYALGATRNYWHHDSCQPISRWRNCVSHTLWTPEKN